MNKKTTPFRTIEAVIFDKVDIGFMTIQELMDLPERKWEYLRNAITDKEHVARCMMCNQPVYIKVNHQKPLFSHYKTNEPECIWHTGMPMTPNAARAAQYQGKQEGNVHKALCRSLNTIVKLDDRYEKSTVEVYKKPTESDFGRYPDVYVEWSGEKPFVLEVQKSKPFQTEVSARCQHYEREDIVLFWLLFGFNPMEDFIAQGFKDAIYRHRGNAFIINSETIKASYKAKTLVVRCYLKQIDNSFSDEGFVKYDNLTFPQKGLPFFKDQILEPLRERRLLWLKAFTKIRKEKEYLPQSIEMEEVQQAFRQLKDVGYDVKPESEVALLNLLGIILSILSHANGNEYIFITRLPNIKAMINDRFYHHRATGLGCFANIVELLLLRTPLKSLLDGTVGEKIKDAKNNKKIIQCHEESLEWSIMEYLFPEIFDRIERQQLISLDVLPAWASEGDF